MTVSTEIQHFWQVAVRHMDYLHKQGFSSSPGFFATRFAKITGEASSFRKEFREKWRGTTYEEFEDLGERRRSYHEGERKARLRQLWACVEGLPEGEPAATLRLSDVEDPITRHLLCKAVHDTSRWQYQKPSAVSKESAVALDVYSLSFGEVEELGRRAQKVARHQVALSVLDEVRHYLGGHDVYDADRREALASPSAIASAVQADHAGKPRPKRVDIAMQEYKLADTYGGKRDERSVRKALHECFRRRENT